MNCLTTLYPHQQRAVDKLLPIRVGALFMEMGTGKTRAAIELAALRQSRIDRVVWFTPVSLKSTVAEEIRKHTDTDEQDIYTFNEDTRPGRLPRAFWNIVGIESMSSSARAVLAVKELIHDPYAGERTMVIMDESSYIKNHRAQRTWRTTELCRLSRYRLLLTGTPLSQGVVDLYSQMNFLSPEILKYRSFYSFARNHLEYSERYPDMIVRAHNVDQLAAKIAPYVYQVTKAECLDLPDKLYDRVYFNMTDEQERLYERAKLDILTARPLEEIDSCVIFQLFTALQTISSGWWTENGKTHVVLHERLSTLDAVIANIPPGEKVIIWCKYLASLEAVADRLAQRGEGVRLLHGEISESERTRQIAAFRSDHRFLVATQATGGHGLTLNEAAYVIFYENGFKFSERIQAEDRCHRIGQERKVTYIDVVCRNGIEQRIQEALARKSNVVQSFRREVQRVKDENRDPHALFSNL